MALFVGKIKRKLSYDHAPATLLLPQPTPSTAAERFLAQRHPLDAPPSLSRPSHALPPSSQVKSSQRPADSFPGVIDLTGSSSPEPESPATSNMKTIIDLTADDSDTAMEVDAALEDDIRIAMKLQAQFDAEDANTKTSQSSRVSKKPKMHDAPGKSLFGFQDEDEKLARELHEKWNGEELPPIFGRGSRSAEEWPTAEQHSTWSGQIRDALPSTDSHTDAAAVLQFGQNQLQIRCTRCRKHLVHDEKSVQKLSVAWSASDGCLSSSVECNKCKTFFTCIGCGQTGNQPLSENQREKLSWCCDQGRLFMIWLLLCFLKAAKPSVGTRKSARSKSLSSIAKPKTSGIGYADNLRPARIKPSNVAVTVIDSEPTDVFVTRLLHSLTALLPSWNENSSFDQEPPQVLLPMIRRSFLLERVAELLRNDSIENVAKRQALYHGVFGFLNALTQHHVTAVIAYEARTVYKAHEQLLPLTFGDVSVLPPTGQQVDNVQSLERAMQNLRIQAEMVVKQANTGNGGADFDSDDHSREVLKLSVRILDLAVFLRTNALHEAKQTSPPVEDMSEWHRENCVEEYPDEELLKGHVYWTEANSITTVAKGRMKRLMMELASLKTSLPDGIYVRHGSSRLDVMKVLIIGPKDTPYENGMFEFDLLCGGEYPNVAPKMKFKTTGNGKAHFNPNLYVDGKICLSLLGTWSGEPWRPGQSTILQVLVSIQSMIFCDEPWCNEPGREKMVGSVQSTNYNKSIRRLTVMYALLEWAEKQPPKSGNGLWTATIDKHFGVNVEHILDTVGRWVSEGLSQVRPASIMSFGFQAPYIGGQPPFHALPPIPPPPMPFPHSPFWASNPYQNFSSSSHPAGPILPLSTSKFGYTGGLVPQPPMATSAQSGFQPNAQPPTGTTAGHQHGFVHYHMAKNSGLPPPFPYQTSAAHGLQPGTHPSNMSNLQTGVHPPAVSNFQVGSHPPTMSNLPAGSHLGALSNPQAGSQMMGIPSYQSLHPQAYHQMAPQYPQTKTLPAPLHIPDIMNLYHMYGPTLGQNPPDGNALAAGQALLKKATIVELVQNGIPPSALWSHHPKPSTSHQKEPTKAKQDLPPAEKEKDQTNIKSTDVKKIQKMNWDLVEKTKHLPHLQKKPVPSSSSPNPSSAPHPSFVPHPTFTSYSVAGAQAAAAAAAANSNQATAADKKLLADLEARLAPYRKKNKGPAHSASAIYAGPSAGQFVAPESNNMDFEYPPLAAFGTGVWE